jgi:hypothetical protein
MLLWAEIHKHSEWREMFDAMLEMFAGDKRSAWYEAAKSRQLL